MKANNVAGWPTEALDLLRQALQPRLDEADADWVIQEVERSISVEWVLRFSDGGRVAAFQAGWASVSKDEPGDRTRAGIAALDAYDRELADRQDGAAEGQDEADPWLEVAGADDE